MVLKENEIGRSFGVRFIESQKSPWYITVYSWIWCEIIYRLPGPLFNFIQKTIKLFKEIRTAIFEPENLKYGFRPYRRVEGGYIAVGKKGKEFADKLKTELRKRKT